MLRLILCLYSTKSVSGYLPSGQAAITLAWAFLDSYALQFAYTCIAGGLCDWFIHAVYVGIAVLGRFRGPQAMNTTPR
jgi:tetrahydromethanopterin S-methyltransferase subunit E